MDDRPVPLRILLVDDQALVRDALTALLREGGAMEVIAVTDTIEESLRRATELDPDVVLVDVSPEADFFESAGYLVRQYPRAKVVLLDDAPHGANVRGVLRINAAGYLTKQQPFAQIEQALRQAARGDRVFAPAVAGRLVLAAEGVRWSGEQKEGRLAALTPRETDVLTYLAQGYSVKQCANALGIGVSTAGNHKSRLMKKLDIHKTVELTRLAMREGLIRDNEPGSG